MVADGSPSGSSGPCGEPSPDFGSVRRAVFERLFGGSGDLQAPAAADAHVPRGTVDAPDATVTWTPRSGDLVAERYPLVALIGEGGAGWVWRAEQVGLDRPVAIKILRNHAGFHGTADARLYAEARMLSKLTHANVVSVFDVGEHQGRPFMVMELVAGTPLDVVQRRDGPMTWKEAAAVLDQVAGGLAAAHALGVVHRDVKPSNIMVQGDASSRSVKLLDFGIARWTSLDAESRQWTRSGAMMGTLGYVSPEAIRGEPVDARADVFALGCLAWELLTGRPAFTGDSPSEVLYGQLFRHPPAVNEARPHAAISDAAESVIRRCLRKDPQRRFADVEAFRSALARANDGHAVPVAREAGEPRPHRTVAFPWRVTTVGALALVAGISWASRGEPTGIDGALGDSVDEAAGVLNEPTPASAVAPSVDAIRSSVDEALPASAPRSTGDATQAPLVDPEPVASVSASHHARIDPIPRGGGAPSRATDERARGRRAHRAATLPQPNQPSPLEAVEPAARSFSSQPGAAPPASPRDWSDPFARRRLQREQATDEAQVSAPDGGGPRAGGE